MSQTIVNDGFPVEDVIAELKTALDDHLNVILEAPPGAGKTTLVPLHLLDSSWLGDQKIIMLEPRRLAARLSAERMAHLLGEEVGKTVGYRIRGEKKVSPDTRIEVVTEGILTRMIQNDPELHSIGLVIFDEFHERNLQADLGLSFCFESQAALRDDLRLLIMSATLEGQALDRLLPDAPKISSQGRSFDVENRYLKATTPFQIPQDCANAILKAINEEDGDVLAFLPGESEIRKTENTLKQNLTQSPDIYIAPLYGALSHAEQNKAISPSPEGQRKVVLATTIAETSLTIDGIRIVVDCGYKRVARFDQTKQLSRLETVRISKASARQRAGRAGRLEHGVCYKLWPKAEDLALRDRDQPEILETDLVSLALDLAVWGARSTEDLNLLDHPNPNAVEKAQTLLKNIDALDEQAGITAHGKDIHRLSLHPRLAHMILKAKEMSDEEGALACDIAAALTDGPLIKKQTDADLRTAISVLQGDDKSQQTAKGALFRAKQTAKDLKRKIKLHKVSASSSQQTGRLLSLAFPDRIAKRRSSTSESYHMTNAMGASLKSDDPLIVEEYLVIAELGGKQGDGRIYSAAPLSLMDIHDLYSDQICEVTDISWDKRSQSAQARKLEKLDGLILSQKPIRDISPDQLSQALCEGIRLHGLESLNWDKEALNFCQRNQFIHAHDDSWTDFSNDALLEGLEEWLLPFLNGVSKLDQLKKINLLDALKSRLSWDDLQKLDRLAPTHYQVPSGSNMRLDYNNPLKPVLAVKLQEMFGQPTSPTLMNGRVNICIHLLSPAGRPLQITEDLASFWANAYDSVKKEMKGRYPKHPWPDNPLEAIATHKTKRKLSLDSSPK